MNNSGMHTVVLPLKASARDIQIVSEAMSIAGKLRNAAMGEMLDRIDRMKADPHWKEAGKLKEQKAKNQAYRELKKEYKVSQQDMVRVCHAHWKASVWMGDRIGGRIAIGMAPELWQNLEGYIMTRTNRPRFKPSKDCSMVVNNDNASGLLLRDGHIKWSIRTKRKCLDIPVDLQAWSRPRREWLDSRIDSGALRRVGIKREMVRGEVRLYAHICLQGSPYRSQEYLEQINFESTDLIGLDLGPTWLAVVSEGQAQEMSIANLERIEQDKKIRRKERNRKRAADRSRAANNQHARRNNGTSIKGVKQPHRSKRGGKRQQHLADIKRKDRINRQQDRSLAVKQVVTTGIHIALEKLNYSGWQKSLFGKRMLITSPGDFTDRLVGEAEMLGGSVVLIDPWKARASQTCLCGEHTGKKKLSERTHNCPSCGLEAHRDMVSAALVRELGLADEQVWDKGLAEARLQEGVPPEWRLVELASRTKHAAVEAILSSCRTPLSDQEEAGSLGGDLFSSSNQSTERSASTVLLCEKQTSDPGVKSQASLHVPTCERSPQKVRAAASRKAAVKKTKVKAAAHSERLP